MNHMFAPIFTLKLKHKIHPRTVTVGKYDGLHPCLSCGTTASKVFIHNPHKPAIGGGRVAVHDSDVSLLNVNQAVSALCAGRLDPAIDRDILCIGSQTNLLAYDIHDNKDLFYKEVPDGVNSLVIGKVSNVSSPLAIAGGNCTLTGFDSQGNDRFWTVGTVKLLIQQVIKGYFRTSTINSIVTGDVVSSLALADFTNDGENELLVGSEDFEIRAFHYDEIIAEMSETEVVTALCPIGGSRYGYALANGTVGVYNKSARYWRIKSKNQVMAIHSYDLDGDGVPELIAGWSNGKIDARSNATGDVIFKDNMTGAVAGLVDADYRLDGKNQLICCSVDGEVRGYQGDQTKIRLIESNRANEDIRDLSLLKQKLQLEMQNYESASQPIDAGQVTSTQILEEGAIPMDTDIQVSLHIEQGATPRVLLKVQTTNDQTVVRMVVIFAEGLFNGESLINHPPANYVTNKILIPLQPGKDMAVEMCIQAFVCLPGSSQFHLFIKQLNLPRFSSYVLTKSLKEIPESYVTFKVNERLNRIALWFGENFLLSEEIPTEGGIKVQMIAIRGGDFAFQVDESGQVTINTDNIDLAGDLIQSLATFLRVEDLQVTAHFPIHQKKLQDIMTTVENLHAVTQKLAAEMTDHSNLIKSLVVRAEDARLQDDYSGMRKGYLELRELNSDLINGYHVRSANHDELVKSLKLVHQIIQKAAHLRVGKYQKQVVSQCRDAIKHNNATLLMKIIQAGNA